MPALYFGLVLLALVGHAAFWVGVVNRWHATGFRRVVVKTVTLAFYAAFAGIPPWVALRWDERPPGLDWTTCYFVFAAVFGLLQIGIWGTRRWPARGYPSVVSVAETRVVDVASVLGYVPARGLRTAVLGWVPGNQLFELNVSEFVVRLPRLPAELEGLTVCHWSDLHMSGRIGREYYRQVVRLTNEWKVDVLALTGDICDVARYIDWIGDELAPARARLGKFFILGNHDLRTRDVARVRTAMGAAGFFDVGGRRTTLDGAPVEVAGNERPWFDRVPPRADGRIEALRILLAHTPDQLTWARGEGFDLMLAGHTHGGQVCFPIVGPVLCPSWHGTKYASGFFHEPPTVLHVSRGTGSLFPLRLGCPPEITKLVLTRGV